MKGIIFDFDGTLIDSMDIWKDLSRMYVESKGFILTEDIAQKMTANSLRMNAAFLKETYGINGTTNEIIDEIGNIIKKYYAEVFELKPNAIETLENYKDKGYKMCLGTATNENLARPALERFDLYKYFDFVQTCDNVGITKGDKKFFKAAAERLGTYPKETFLFDDANYALKAANEAEVVTVAVYDKNSHTMWEENKRISDYHLIKFRDWLSKD